MTLDGGLPPDDEDFFDDTWDDDSEELEEVPAWRRPVLIGVAVVTAVALALVPLYNVLRSPTIADNGLEVCGFDYCVVEDAVRSAGLGDEMSGLFNIILDDESAVRFAREMTDQLGVEPVVVTIVDDLEGRIGGLYDPETRSIFIERPARAWTVVHEVAHAVETGHGNGFQKVLIELTATFDGE